MSSPLLHLPGAIRHGSAETPPADGAPTPPSGDGTRTDATPADQQPSDPQAAAAHPDAAIAWHYGDPLAEQRAAATSAALFDRSNRELIALTGDDRLTWLHTVTSQHTENLADGSVTEALVLSPQGHVEHHFGVTVVGDTVYLDTEPDAGAALLGYLESMKFWSKVELAAVPLALLRISGPTAAFDGAPPAGAAARGDGFVRVVDTGAGPDGPAIRTIEVAVPRDELGPLAAAIVGDGTRPAGSWAAEALRIPTRMPRLGVDTDDRTIPNETRWLQSAVHLDKGCYRGQETVARVDNLGRPPRRIVMLNLDGSADRLPEPGDDVLTGGENGGRKVGRVGTVAHHWEDGPIALALIKRSVPIDTPLLAGGVDALIDPDDALPEDEATPRSAIDRKSLPNIHRR